MKLPARAVNLVITLYEIDVGQNFLDYLCYKNIAPALHLCRF